MGVVLNYKDILSSVSINTEVEPNIETDIVGFNSLFRSCCPDLNHKPYGYQHNMRVQIKNGNMCKKLMPNKKKFKKKRMLCGLNNDKYQKADQVIIYTLNNSI